MLEQMALQIFFLACFCTCFVIDFAKSLVMKPGKAQLQKTAHHLD